MMRWFAVSACVGLASCGSIAAESPDAALTDAAKDLGGADTTPSDSGSRPDTDVADVAIDDGIDAGGLVTTCGGKLCRGTCWPTADECACNGLPGGCPEKTVCCPGKATCLARCP